MGFRSASMIPFMPSPGNPNTASTASRRSGRGKVSAVVVSIGHSTGQRYPAERINEHHNYQDEPDDTDASAASPPRISVIATASAEQEHCENNQQQHGIVLSGTVGPNPICRQTQTKTVP